MKLNNSAEQNQMLTNARVDSEILVYKVFILLVFLIELMIVNNNQTSPPE